MKKWLKKKCPRNVGTGAKQSRSTWPGWASSCVYKTGKPIMQNINKTGFSFQTRVTGQLLQEPAVEFGRIRLEIKS